MPSPTAQASAGEITATPMSWASLPTVGLRMIRHLVPSKCSVSVARLVCDWGAEYPTAHTFDGDDAAAAARAAWSDRGLGTGTICQVWHEAARGMAMGGGTGAFTWPNARAGTGANHAIAIGSTDSHPMDVRRFIGLLPVRS